MFNARQHEEMLKNKQTVTFWPSKKCLIQGGNLMRQTEKTLKITRFKNCIMLSL